MRGAPRREARPGGGRRSPRGGTGSDGDTPGCLVRGRVIVWASCRAGRGLWGGLGARGGGAGGGAPGARVSVRVVRAGGAGWVRSRGGVGGAGSGCGRGDGGRVGGAGGPARAPL